MATPAMRRHFAAAAPRANPAPRARAAPADAPPPSEPPRLLWAAAPAPGHDYLGHAECATRVPAILDALAAHGLDAAPGVARLELGAPPLELLLPAAELVHPRGFLQKLERAAENARDVAGLIIESAPTYCTPSSYADALRAAAAACALVDAVVAAAAAGAPAAGFGLVRPPGHHAVPRASMGFCLLNNAAVAARHAQRAHGLIKVAILDIDVHHGNGTEDAFLSDPSVLFVSTHGAGGYPGSGAAAEAGAGDGAGANVNLPLPGGAGHEAALAAWDEVIGPAVRRFAPDIIIVSAGFDAHWKDPLGMLSWRSSTFHALAGRASALAAELCAGRLVLLLEGGYDLGALGESVASAFAGLLGRPAIDSLREALPEEPLERVRAAIRETQRVHGL